MNWRIYLTVLRPRDMLLSAVCYTLLGALMTNGHWGDFHFTTRDMIFLTLAIVFPLIWGTIVATATHEQLHRPTILLLPAALTHWRRATIWFVLISAGLVTGLMAAVAPTVPLIASYGLAAGLMTIYFPNRYRLLLGLNWPAAIILLCLIFYLKFAGHLQTSMIAAPWLYFLGGLALAAGCLALGFSPRNLRGRTETVCFTPLVTNFSVIFDRSIQAQLRRQHAHALQHDRKRPQSPDRDWQFPSVGPATKDWMKVIWSATYLQRGTWLRLHFIYGIVALLLFLSLPCLYFAFKRLFGTNPGDISVTYWNCLSLIGAPVLPERNASGFGLDFLVFFSLLGQAGLASMIFLLTPLPQLAYPISRSRMAKTVLTLTIRQLSTALLLSTMLVLFISWVGQIGSGHLLSIENHAGTGTTALLLAVMLPQIACASMVRSLFVRLVWGVVSVGGTMVAGTASGLLSNVLWTPWGLPSCVLAIGASVSLLWWRLRQHYLHSDLSFEKGLFGSSGAPMK